MDGITLEIAIILILVLANGVFSMSEIAVISSRKTRLQHMADEGSTTARAALELASKPGRFLSTIQTGITLVGVLAGAFGGATLTQSLSDWLAGFGPLRPYAGPLALGIVVLCITYLSIVLGELVPKRIALGDSERIACFAAGPMALLSRAATPAVALLSHSTDAVVRLLGIRPSEEPPVTEEELRILIDQGTRAGVFEESEQEMIEGVLELKDRCAGDLVTPRTKVVWLDLAAPQTETLERIRTSGFAAFPVCRGSLDEVVGVVHSKDLLAQGLSGHKPDLEGAMKPPHLVPEGMDILDLLESFRSTGQHMAVVLDEYGGIAGVVTATNIVEFVVGAMPGPGEIAGPPAFRREDGSWLLDGRMPAGEAREILGIPKAALASEEKAVRTLGGLVMSKLGRVPTAGDYFTWAGRRFEVVDMDGRRVDKVLVHPSGDDAGAPGGG